MNEIDDFNNKIQYINTISFVLSRENLMIHRAIKKKKTKLDILIIDNDKDFEEVDTK